MVQLLLNYGAVAGARVELYGDTALHGAVERGESDDYSLPRTEAGSSLPKITVGHVRVVNLFLRRGIVPTLESHDGKTAQSFASEGLESWEGLTDDERNMLRRIIEDFNNPPPVKTKTIRPAWNPLPPEISSDALQVREYFKVRIQFCKPGAYRYRNAPIGSLLYNSEKSASWRNEIKALDDCASEASQSAGNTTFGETSKLRHWRWIHLPANNVSLSHRSHLSD